MWKGFPHWQRGGRIEVCFFPALEGYDCCLSLLLKNRVSQRCVRCRQWSCWNCWLQFELEGVIQKSRPVCVVPLAQLRARHLKASCNPRLPSFFSFVPSQTCSCLGVFTEWRSGGSSSPLPERCRSSSRLLRTCRARQRARCCCWASLPLPCGLPGCPGGPATRGRRLCAGSRRMTGSSCVCKKPK